MNLAIITGGSKGLGKALVRTYCLKGFKVINISRTNSCLEHDNLLGNLNYDLTNIELFNSLTKNITKLTQNIIFKEVILINNAGTLGDIITNEKSSAQNINHTINLNLTTPLVLTSIITKLFINIKISVYNISSGAANKPYFGWSNYNASKSGLSLATRSIALEQENNTNFKIFNIIPGVIDTQMQKQIRDSKKENFKHIAKFTSMKEEGLLQNPLDVALKIYNIRTMNYKSGYTINLKHI